MCHHPFEHSFKPESKLHGYYKWIITRRVIHYLKLKIIVNTNQCKYISKNV